MIVELVALPMKEAQAYWADKKIVTRKEFNELSERAMARAFTVAGLSAQDQLAGIHAAIAKATQDGESLADFKTRIQDIVEQQGWTGQKAWRVDTIFRTNIQSAYQAGRFVQMRRATKTRPYWRYVAVADSRTRPTHLALHGMVYPADHDFWSRFYPPNGFRCRCTVQTLSAKQVEARGYEVQKDMPGMVEPVDPKTGERLLPVRPAPDKGFAQNTAEDWIASLTPREIDERDLRVLPVQARCRDGKGMFADGPCKVPLAELDARHIKPFSSADLLDGQDKERHVLAFLREFGIKNIDGQKVVRLPGNHLLAVNKWLFTDKASGRFKATWSDKGPYMRLLARTILDPFEVWWAPVEIGPQKRLVYSLRLIRLFQLPGEERIGGYSAFHLIGGQYWSAATAFAPKADRSFKARLDYLESMRSGILLHREALK